MENSITSTISTAWNKSKWLVKGCIIGVIALLLMVPMIYVNNLVFEREERQKQATREITSKWAGKQNILPPVIGIPFWKKVGIDTSSKATYSKDIAYFLPDQVSINAQINPKEKHRGIFKVMLYDSRINITASFSQIPLQKLGIAPDQCIWKEAFVMMNIADNKGLNDQLTLNWKDTTIELSPDYANGSTAMKANLNVHSLQELSNASFSAIIDLNGSEQLLFTPVGKSTTVNISSTWKHPSFNGSTLPQNSNVKDSGFTAIWKSMSHKRNFRQEWIGNEFTFDPYTVPATNEEHIRVDGSVVSTSPIVTSVNTVAASAFGVDLYIPVNEYQKTQRTIKYAILCILLTFAAFFIIETGSKKSAHPFQYGLIGLALILFYTLLLSISEYTGFNIAYIISSIATIGLIAWFVRGILDNGRSTTILSVILVILYSYIFSLLQLKDYSLLLGSIGLFITLAAIMYFSKKLKW